MASVADTGRGGGRRPRPERLGLPRPCLLGRDVFVLPVPRRDASGRGTGDARIPDPPPPGRANRGAELERAGARFPWESAGDGCRRDARSRTTCAPASSCRSGPASSRSTSSPTSPGRQRCYLDWTGDEAFAAGPGRELLVETARYWASRVRLDGDGRGHIYGVIGPDEYHEPVDDNAFTNVMARWNLRRAAELADGVVTSRGTRALAGARRRARRRLRPRERALRAVRRLLRARAARDRRGRAARGRSPPTCCSAPSASSGAQVIEAGGRADAAPPCCRTRSSPARSIANLDFYEPRTAHGSSLSPGVHAALFARAGRLPEALDALRLASRIDLDDLTQTTAGGLHLATMGGLWQALAFGFAGLRPEDGILQLDPRLPKEWSALKLRLRFRGSRVRLRIEPTTTSIHADPAISIRIAGSNTVRTVPPDGLRLKRSRPRLEKGGSVSKLIAAIDNSAAARPILATAAALARLLPGRGRGGARPRERRQHRRRGGVRSGIPLRTLEPPVTESLVGVAKQSGVRAVVFGTRSSPTGPNRPVRSRSP